MSPWCCQINFVIQIQAFRYWKSPVKLSIFRFIYLYPYKNYSHFQIKCQLYYLTNFFLVLFPEWYYIRNWRKEKREFHKCFRIFLIRLWFRNVLIKKWCQWGDLNAGCVKGCSEKLLTLTCKTGKPCALQSMESQSQTRLSYWTICRGHKNQHSRFQYIDT